MHSKIHAQCGVDLISSMFTDKTINVYGKKAPSFENLQNFAAGTL